MIASKKSVDPFSKVPQFPGPLLFVEKVDPIGSKAGGDPLVMADLTTVNGSAQATLPPVPVTAVDLTDASNACGWIARANVVVTLR